MSKEIMNGVDDFCQTVELEPSTYEFEKNPEENIQGDELTYPCIVIEGVTTKPELEYLSRIPEKKGRSLPLFVHAFDMNLRLGWFPVESTTMILVSTISLGSYKVFLCKSENDRKEIDIDDMNTRLKSISFA